MPDLRVIDTRALLPTPWKNGGGITREVARSGASTADAWRLSIAEVAIDGAFSVFPGMSRILTVIDGDGLALHSADAAHNVPFGIPFAFLGETPIRSVLHRGPIVDFNVIYDPRLIAATVRALAGPIQIDVTAHAGAVLGVLGMIGAFRVNATAARPGDFALIEGGDLRLWVPDNAHVLLVELHDVPAQGAFPA